MTRFHRILDHVATALGHHQPGPGCPACGLHHWGSCDHVPAPAMPLTVCDRWGHQASTTDPTVCLDCRRPLEQAA